MYLGNYYLVRDDYLEVFFRGKGYFDFCRYGLDVFVF